MRNVYYSTFYIRKKGNKAYIHLCILTRKKLLKNSITILKVEG